LLATLDAVADPRRAAGAAHDRHVRHVDRHVLVDDAALHRGPGRPLVTLRDVDAVDDDLVAVTEHAGDPTLLPDVLAGEHLHAIALLDLHGVTAPPARATRFA